MANIIAAFISAIFVFAPAQQEWVSFVVNCNVDNEDEMIEAIEA